MAVNGSQLESGAEKIMHQHFSDWRVRQSEVSEGKNEGIWRVCTRTDSRRSKLAEYHPGTYMKDNSDVQPDSFLHLRHPALGCDTQPNRMTEDEE